MEVRRSVKLVETLRRVAPGTGLREGLDRILQAHMGALVLIGDGPDVLSICSGGFLIDSEFSPQRIYELAKMDGAIVLSSDGARIARANVHLVPDSSVATSETGTRHRTAERVARSISVPVLAISEELSVVSVYRGGFKHQLRSVPSIIDRAHQALSTLERYKDRLDGVLGNLDRLEVSHEARFKDVALVLQRGELVRRISEEIAWYLLELGSEGRLLALQLDELYIDFEGDYLSVIQDFLEISTKEQASELVSYLASVPMEDLLDLSSIANGIREHSCCSGLSDFTGASPLEVSMASRGSRLISSVPQIPNEVRFALLDTFGGLKPIVEATAEQLAEVDGVGTRWARAVKEHLSQTDGKIIEV